MSEPLDLGPIKARLASVGEPNTQVDFDLASLIAEVERLRPDGMRASVTIHRLDGSVDGGVVPVTYDEATFTWILDFVDLPTLQPGEMFTVHWPWEQMA